MLGFTDNTSKPLLSNSTNDLLHGEPRYGQGVFNEELQTSWCSHVSAMCSRQLCNTTTKAAETSAPASLICHPIACHNPIQHIQLYVWRLNVGDLSQVDCKEVKSSKSQLVLGAKMDSRHALSSWCVTQHSYKIIQAQYFQSRLWRIIPLESRWHENSEQAHRESKNRRSFAAVDHKDSAVHLPLLKLWQTCCHCHSILVKQQVLLVVSQGLHDSSRGL